ATAEHGEQYIAKLRGLPAALATLADAATQAAQEGRVALSRLLNETADSVDAYLATPVGPDERFNCQPAPTGLSDAEATAWRAERDQVVADVVRPGLAAYGEAIRDLARRGRGDAQPGLCQLEGGDAV